jgi:hypothetical protein
VRFELGRQIFLAERVLVEVGDERDEIDDLITLQAPREILSFLLSAPLVGCNKLVRILTVVLLPDPLGPSRPRTSPGRTVNETS